MPKTLLVVDDDPTMTKTIGLWLRRTDYTATFCNTADEGLAHIESGKFQVLLTDMKLDRGTGNDLIREAHAKGMETVAMTGFADIDMLEELLDGVVSDYVPKTNEKFKDLVFEKLQDAFCRVESKTFVQQHLDPTNLNGTFMRAFGQVFYEQTMSLHDENHRDLEKIRDMLGEDHEACELIDRVAQRTGSLKKDLAEAHRSLLDPDDLEEHDLADLVRVALASQTLVGRSFNMAGQTSKGLVVGEREKLVWAISAILALAPRTENFRNDDVSVTTAIDSERSGGSIGLHVEHEVLGPAPDDYVLLADAEDLIGVAGRTFRGVRSTLEVFGGDLSWERVSNRKVSFTLWFCRKSPSVAPWAAE